MAVNKTIRPHPITAILLVIPREVDLAITTIAKITVDRMAAIPDRMAPIATMEMEAKAIMVIATMATSITALAIIAITIIAILAAAAMAEVATETMAVTMAVAITMTMVH